MNIEEFKTWEEGDKVFVYISLPLENTPRIPRMYLEPPHVVDLLKEKNIEVGPCITGENILERELGFLRKKCLTNLRKVLY